MSNHPHSPREVHGIHQDEANRHRALKQGDARLAAMTEDRDEWKRRALLAEGPVAHAFTTPVAHRYTPLAINLRMALPGGLDNTGFSPGCTV